MIHFQQEFDRLISSLPTEKSAMQKLRKDAFNDFLQIGLPTKKWEDWRFTDFSSIEDFPSKILDSNQRDALDLSLNKISGAYHIISINGLFQSSLSSLPKHITIKTGDEFFDSHHSVFINNKDSNPFEFLNTSFMRSGLSININENVIIDKPIQIINIITDSAASKMIHPRLFIESGKNSDATIIEHYYSMTDNEFLHNPVSQINLNKNAVMKFVRIVENNRQLKHIGKSQFDLKQDSQLQYVSFSCESNLIRHDIAIDFNGDGATASLNGLSISEKDEHQDQNIILNHLNNFCNSDQSFKNILSDSSSGVFNGKVIVHKGTRQTDANQSNKNLVLSPSSLMNANPQLEIYSEDVKCSHGSTTGQISPEELFYLRSRGLNKKKAMELIVEGFAADIIELIQFKEAREYISNRVSAILGRVLA